jgi:hypothetical protein
LNLEELSEAPPSPTVVEPMDEDPSNEAFVLSLLEGYEADEVEAMEIEPTPRMEDWRAKYLAWMDRGELPPDRFEARRIARMAKSFTLIDGELYKHAASGVLQRCIPIPQGRELIQDIHAGICGHLAHRAPSWVTRSARASTGPPRSPTPVRLYAPAWGASSTPARLTSQPTPSR